MINISNLTPAVVTLILTVLAHALFTEQQIGWWTDVHIGSKPILCSLPVSQVKDNLTVDGQQNSTTLINSTHQ